MQQTCLQQLNGGAVHLPASPAVKASSSSKAAQPCLQQLGGGAVHLAQLLQADLAALQLLEQLI